MPLVLPGLDTMRTFGEIFWVGLTRVFLIRHGATELTAEDRFAGSTDVKLSDIGRAQVMRLADRLSLEKVAGVYCSDLSRTQETAAILAAPHRIEVQPRPGLREIAHGHWEGMTRQEVENKWPEEAQEWENDPFTFAPPGGESGLAVTARALPALLDYGARACGPADHRRLAQGDHPADPELAPRIRSASLPRQSRPATGRVEHCRFSRSEPRTADSFQ